MLRFQRYVYIQALRPVLGVLAALAAIAVLSQGLAHLDLIVEKRQSALALIWVTLLTLPQVISLILPIALFFAVAFTLNRLLRDSELIAAYANGFSPWEAAAPVMRLAALAAVTHLAVTVLVQPMAYREMRATLARVAADVAASMIRQGAFIEPAEGLTLYARVERAGAMRDILLHDARDPAQEVTFTAQEARFAMMEEAPALLLLNGQFQVRSDTGVVDFVDFQSYTLALPSPEDLTSRYILKPPDRFLAELFKPDRTFFYDQRNLARFLAEGHFRLSAPLHSFALTALALAALLAGEFSRNGYRRRILIAGAAAMTVRLLSLAAQSACVDAPELNWVQYALPLGAFAASMLAIAWYAPPWARPAALPAAP